MRMKISRNQTTVYALATALILGCSTSAKAQTNEGLYDITSQVLHNADLSTDITQDTDNKWVFVSPGSHAYQSGTWKDTDAPLSDYVESYINTKGNLSDFYFAQTTPQLPKGTYTITFNYNGAVNNVNGGELMTNMVAFANATTQVLEESYAAENASSDVGTFSFEYENTADAPITLGVKTTGETNANWIALDNFKIEFRGTQADYEAACNNMTAMRRNVSDYLKDYTRYICNASCSIDEFKNNHSWSRNGAAGGYAESPAAITSDGTYGISYWNGSAQTDKELIYQTVNYLPAGKYRLTGKAAATVWNDNKGNDNKPGVYFFAGDQQTEVNTAKYGDYTVDFSVANDGDAVTLGLKADENNANTWCFLSSLKLMRFSDVTLSEDNTEMPEDEELVNVTVNRTLKAGKWNTLCLPFSMTVPEGWEAKQLSGEGSAEGSLVFEAATDIEAGKTYIVKPAEEVSEIKAEGVDIISTTTATSTDNYSMAGNFAKQYVPQGSYFISDNKFYLADQADAVELKGFRAYITANEPSKAPAKLTIGDTATGISEVEGADTPADNNYYTLSGILVKQPQRGVYIHNKKVIFIR
jgi:hypothetical protein